MKNPRSTLPIAAFVVCGLLLLLGAVEGVIDDWSMVIRRNELVQEDGYELEELLRTTPLGEDVDLIQKLISYQTKNGGSSNMMDYVIAVLKGKPILNQATAELYEKIDKTYKDVKSAMRRKFLDKVAKYNEKSVAAKKQMSDGKTQTEQEKTELKSYHDKAEKRAHAAWLKARVLNTATLDVNQESVRTYFNGILFRDPKLATQRLRLLVRALDQIKKDTEFGRRLPENYRILINLRTSFDEYNMRNANYVNALRPFFQSALEQTEKDSTMGRGPDEQQGMNRVRLASDVSQNANAVFLHNLANEDNQTALQKALNQDVSFSLDEDIAYATLKNNSLKFAVARNYTLPRDIDFNAEPRVDTDAEPITIGTPAFIETGLRLLIDMVENYEQQLHSLEGEIRVFEDIGVLGDLTRFKLHTDPEATFRAFMESEEDALQLISELETTKDRKKFIWDFVADKLKLNIGVTEKLNIAMNLLALLTNDLDPNVDMDLRQERRVLLDRARQQIKKGHSFESFFDQFDDLVAVELRAWLKHVPATILEDLKKQIDDQHNKDQNHDLHASNTKIVETTEKSMQDITKYITKADGKIPLDQMMDSVQLIVQQLLQQLVIPQAWRSGLENFIFIQHSRLDALYKPMLDSKLKFVSDAARLKLTQYLSSWQLRSQDNSTLMSVHDPSEDTPEASVEMKKLAFRPIGAPLGEASHHGVVGWDVTFRTRS